MNYVNKVLQQFSFLESWNTILFLLIVFLSYYYIKMMKQDQSNYKNLRTTSFLAAALLFYVVNGSPFNILSNHFLFSLKMIQESISYFLVPILLIIAFPPKILQFYLWDHRLRKRIKFFTNPTGSMVMFYIIYSVYHLPLVFSFFMNNMVFGILVEAVLLFSATCMWWSLISPVQGVSDLPDFKKVIFIVINSILLFIPMYPLAFYGLPNYTYMGHELIETMTAEHDFKLGAGFILIYQKLIVSIIIGIIFVRWFRREDTIDPVNVSGLMGVKDVNKK